MPKRRSFKKSTSLKERLAMEATQLRKEAQGIPPGLERELLVRKARRAETASRMIEWLTSAPKHQDRFKQKWLFRLLELKAGAERGWLHHRGKPCAPSASGSRRPSNGNDCDEDHQVCANWCT
jgi:hypothetical protein